MEHKPSPQDATPTNDELHPMRNTFRHLLGSSCIAAVVYMVISHAVEQAPKTYHWKIILDYIPVLPHSFMDGLSDQKIYNILLSVMTMVYGLCMGRVFDPPR